jgi:FAD/FMN-containing dehydrogenase
MGILTASVRDRLRTELRGRVLLPEDPGWDDARRAWQLLVDQRPVAVIEAAGVDDVVATVLTARRAGLGVAPQATGHAAGAVGGLADAILLRTDAMTDITIDADAGVVRVGAGARWSAVVAAADAAGFAVVAGMSPTVGAVGFSLGGGLGWLGRSHGLASGRLRAIEGVDARGRTVRADAAENPELLWAARGGVVPLIVTAIEIDLQRVPHLQAGSLLWPLERAADVAHAWREWIATVPDSVTSLARVLRFPPLEVFPEAMRGRAFVGVEVAIQEADADALLTPLRALRPEIDTVRAMSPAELGTVHGDPVDPAPAHGEAIVLSEISAPVIDALVGAVASEQAAAVLSVELRHLGGRLASGGFDGAVSGIAGEGLVMAVGIVPVPEALAAVRAGTASIIDRLRPFASEQLVKTFAERPVAPEALYGDALTRLREIGERWDPDGLIRAAHGVRSPRVLD